MKFENRYNEIMNELSNGETIDEGLMKTAGMIGLAGLLAASSFLTSLYDKGSDIKTGPATSAELKNFMIRSPAFTKELENLINNEKEKSSELTDAIRNHDVKELDRILKNKMIRDPKFADDLKKVMDSITRQAF